MDNRKLVTGLIRGDHSSYEALFNLFFVKFVNFVNSILNDKAIAKDIVQEAFIRVWLNRNNLNENQSIENYIYVIVKRLLLNHIRDAKPKENLQSTKVNSIKNSEWDSEQDLIIIAGETRRYLDELVSKMPVQRRKVFIMSRYEGMTNKEIASALNISVKTVERHIVSRQRKVHR